LRLLFLNPTGVVGGAEACLLDVLAGLRADRPGWPLRVLLGDDGPLREAVESLGVDCEVLEMPARLARLGDSSASSSSWAGRRGLLARGFAAGPSAASYALGLRRRLRALRPDAVHTNGMKAHALGAWAAGPGTPVVWHLHDYCGARPLMARLLRASARPGVRVVAVSDSVAADARATLGPRSEVVTLPNAVDLKRFRPASAGEAAAEGRRLDAEAGFAAAGAGVVRVGLVATFARWKGHEVFLRAVAGLPETLPARFYVVGGPLYKSAGSQYGLAELRALAGSLGVAGRVGFVGHRGDPEGAYRGLDVVAHASTRPEPFGRVIVEAMACGRAVVVAPTGGAAGLFEDGVSAVGSPPGDPSALAATLARLVGDPALRARLGEGGRARALADYDRGRLGSQWAGIFEGAAGGRLARAAVGAEGSWADA